MNVASYGNEGQNPYITFQRTEYMYQSFQKSMGSPFTSSVNELGSQNLNPSASAVNNIDGVFTNTLNPQAKYHYDNILSKNQIHLYFRTFF